MTMLVVLFAGLQVPENAHACIKALCSRSPCLKRLPVAACPFSCALLHLTVLTAVPSCNLAPCMLRLPQPLALLAPD